MADKKDDGIEGRPADPFVAARINNPAESPAPSFQLAGLLGDSDREGYRRLYLNTRLDYYVEFRVADVLTVEDVGAQEPPFVGLDATRVSLAKDAKVDYVRSQSGQQDAFAVDAREAARPAGFSPADNGLNLPTDFTAGTNLTTVVTGFESQGVTCVPDTADQDCFWTITCWTQQRCFTQQRTCGFFSCNTCGNATCQTCFQGTCQTCGQATCRTCNNQVTCRTCNLNECFQTIRTCISQAIRCPTLACP